MSPAERETPAGEAMREAVIARAMEAFNKRYGYHRPVIEDLLVDFGEILVDFASEDALTTLRADHAAKVARKDTEIARLRTGVQAIIDGNYPSPRYCRPKPCPHGLHHWQECGECVDAALTQLIATTETADA